MRGQVEVVGRVLHEEVEPVAAFDVDLNLERRRVRGREGSAPTDAALQRTGRYRTSWSQALEDGASGPEVMCSTSSRSRSK